MPGSVVACPSCGKKYRLPEGREIAEIACKACGGVIPVAADEAPPEERPRRGRRAAPPPKSKTPIILIGAGALVVIVILAVVLLGGNGDDKGTESTDAGTAGTGGTGGTSGGGGTNPPPPPPPTHTDYGDTGRAARIEFGKLYKQLPKKPRRPASRGGVVSNEDWKKWEEAKALHAEALKVGYGTIAASGKQFLADFPNSEWEIDIAGGVLYAVYKTEDYPAVLSLADEYLSKYSLKLAAVCHQFKGDAYDKMEEFAKAAQEYAQYYEAADSSKAHKAAAKRVLALVKAGKTTDARAVGADLMQRTPRSERLISTYLKPVGLVGKPLPPTPGQKLLLSEETIDWNALKGKVTLVIVWTSQDTGPAAAMKAAGEMAGRLSDVPFQIVGVCMEEKAEDESIDQWLASNDVRDFTFVVQRGQWSASPILRAWGLASEGQLVAFPITFLLDKTGRVRYAGVPVGTHMEKLIRAMN